MTSAVNLHNNFRSSQYKRLDDISADTCLLSTHSLSKLDVSVNHEGQARLRKLSFWERFLILISSAISDARMFRMRAYIQTVYCCPLKANIDVQKQFYKFLGQRCKWVDFSRLSPRIIEGLSPHLSKTRAIAQRFLPTSCELWEAHLAEVALAKELGIDPVSAGGGVNNAKFCLGLNGKPLTVCKTQATDKRRINEKTFGFRTQPEICGHDPRIAGAVVARADKHFGFCIVPHTGLDTDGNSHQIFVDQTVDASKAKFKGKLLKDRPIEDFDLEELSFLAERSILNYLVGDIDTKDDKLRMELSHGKICAVFETDNDNAFPLYALNSKDWWTLRKTYFWRKHEWAQHILCQVPEDSRLKQILMNIFNPNHVMAFVEQINETYPGFFVGKRLELFFERIAILKAAIQLKIPLRELGEIYSMDCFKEQNMASFPQDKRDRFWLLKNAIAYYKKFPEENPLQPMRVPSTDSSFSPITTAVNWALSWVY